MQERTVEMDLYVLPDNVWLSERRAGGWRLVATVHDSRVDCVVAEDRLAELVDRIRIHPDVAELEIRRCKIPPHSGTEELWTTIEPLKEAA